MREGSFPARWAPRCSRRRRCSSRQGTRGREEECGRISFGASVTCSGTSYPDGIFYGVTDTAKLVQGNNAITIAATASGPLDLGIMDDPHLQFGFVMKVEAGLRASPIGRSPAVAPCRHGIAPPSRGAKARAGGFALREGGIRWRVECVRFPA